MSSELTSSAGAGLGALGGSLLALALVVGLILGLAWLLRRLPGSAALRGHPELRLVASLAVGMRERVVVVVAGGQQLVLGVTAERITLLQTLDTPIRENQPDFRLWLGRKSEPPAS